MLLPDNINPKNSIYYNGALVLKIMQENKRLSISDLFVKTQEISKMSFSVLLLCLDWLYLLNIVIINKKGVVSLCS